MTFTESFLPGVWIHQPHHFSDHRGGITKVFQRTAFQEHGISCDYGETLLSWNKQAGTIRGFHFQNPPYTQSKLMHCLSGGCTIYLLDLRKGSHTFGKIDSIELCSDKQQVLLTPPGVANAFCIRQDHTTLLYQLTSKYMPEYDAGVRWDSLGIDFGVDAPIVSEKDLLLPRWDEFDSPFLWRET